MDMVLSSIDSNVATQVIYQVGGQIGYKGQFFKRNAYGADRSWMLQMMILYLDYTGGFNAY